LRGRFQVQPGVDAQIEKVTQPGYVGKQLPAQARMNDALRDWLKTHSPV